MNAYAQFIVLYTSYIVASRVRDTMSLTKYIFRIPYYLLVLANNKNSLPSLNLEGIVKDSENYTTLVITKSPRLFNVNHVTEKKEEEDDFETVTMLNNVGDNFKTISDVAELSPFFITNFQRIVIDSRKFNIFCLKIIYDNACFFATFPEFLELIRKYKIIIIHTEDAYSKIYKFVL